MSQAETVIEALKRASGEFDDAAFPWADLCVIVWKADPAAFGMTGYTDLYPDTKKICSLLTRIKDRHLVELRPGGANGQGVWKLRTTDY